MILMTSEETTSLSITSKTLERFNSDRLTYSAKIDKALNQDQFLTVLLEVVEKKVIKK